MKTLFKTIQNLPLLTVLVLIPGLVCSQSFGSLQHAYDVYVTRIFSGQSTTYLEFTSLPGCVNNGGYLSVSWPSANGGAINEHRVNQMVATLLFAKATNTAMEVRYRHNQAPTGWDSCAIDAVFLK